MHEFVYDNKALTYNATMWIKGEEFGNTYDRVAFRSPYGFVDWHGRARHDAAWDTILMDFNYRGAGRTAHPCHVIRVGANCWRGWDYQLREIEMTYVRSWKYCTTCQMWK